MWGQRKTVVSKLDRQMGTDNHSSLAWKSGGRNLHWNQRWGGKTWHDGRTGSSVWTSLRVKTPEGPSVRGTSTVLWVLLLELYQILPFNIRGKSLCASWRRSKVTILKYARPPRSYKGLSSIETMLLEPKLVVFHSLTDLREGEYLSPAVGARPGWSKVWLVQGLPVIQARS